MLYDVDFISKQLNIGKVSVYAKFQLKEVKPFVVSQNGNRCVCEKGLEAVKQSLIYNQTISEDEDLATAEIEVLKNDMIQTLKNNIEFLKEQLNIKDQQILNMNDHIRVFLPIPPKRYVSE